MAELTTILSYTPKSATSQTKQDFFEDTDNGTNKITVQAPDTIASDKVLTLPDETGTVSTREYAEAYADSVAAVAGLDIGLSLAISRCNFLP